MNKPFEETPSTQTLMLFAAWRLEPYGGGVSEQTVSGDISALGHLYEELGVKNNPVYSNEYKWKQFKLGLAKRRKEPMQAPAISMESMLKCVRRNRKNASRMRTSTAEHDLASALMLFLLGIRRKSAGKLWLDPEDGNKSDIRFALSQDREAYVMIVVVRHQKNHKQSEPMRRIVPDTNWGPINNGEDFWPVEWLRSYFQQVPVGYALRAPFTSRKVPPLEAGWNDAPYTNWGPMTDRFTEPLKDGKAYTPHSFRRGLYTAAFKSGTTAEDLKKYGNWASAACELYYNMSRERVISMFERMVEAQKVRKRSESLPNADMYEVNTCVGWA